MLDAVSASLHGADDTATEAIAGEIAEMQLYIGEVKLQAPRLGGRDGV